jgi:SAM-dependent methyltransferase
MSAMAAIGGAGGGDNPAAACPLCGAASAADFFRDHRRGYFRCGTCALIFADPAARLEAAAERAVYAQHRNDPRDPRYRQFLGRLAQPLLQRLGPPPLNGLDFGCGPGPTLSLMLAEAGYPTAVYDPYFAPDTAVLERRYDFVTCSEAIEHFHTPAREWAQLVALLRPGGWLGIMTKLATDAAAFDRWHYKNDPTHVSFFSRDTFRYLAERDRLSLSLVGDDVMLLQTPA